MELSSLRELHRHTPFRLFSLRLADGRSLEVPHPEVLAISERGRKAVVMTAANDWFEIVDVPLILGATVKLDSGGDTMN